MTYRRVNTFTSVMFVFAIVVCCTGCEKKLPPNPALEVLNNPPTEFVEGVFSTVEVYMDEREFGENFELESTEVAVGDEINIRVKLIKIQRDAANSFIEFRLLPSATVDADWNNFAYAEDSFFGSPVQHNGEGKSKWTVKAKTGAYDVRCYAVSHDFTREVPEFYLLRKGQIRIHESPQ